MKELLRITLDERQIREACETAVRSKLNADMREENVRASLKPRSGSSPFSVEVVVTKRRAPRKPKSNGVASAGELSEAERRFA